MFLGTKNQHFLQHILKHHVNVRFGDAILEVPPFDYEPKLVSTIRKVIYY